MDFGPYEPEIGRPAFLNTNAYELYLFGQFCTSQEDKRSVRTYFPYIPQAI